VVDWNTEKFFEDIEEKAKKVLGTIPMKDRS
jgi:hypothetical protein